MVSLSSDIAASAAHQYQGKASKTRKFAAVKRMINPSDPRL